MPTYSVRYGDTARQVRDTLPSHHLASLEQLLKKLSTNPFGYGAQSNKNNSWSASFPGGFIEYIVSNNNLVINVIRIAAL